MPSPIAHSVSGYVLAKFLKSGRNRPSLHLEMFYAVFVAVVADFDFIPQLLTQVDFHRGLTHTLIFALSFSLIVSLFISKSSQYSYQKIFWFTLILYSSHLLLDLFTQGGEGMQILWPFTDIFFQSPVPLFPAVHHSRGLFDPSHFIFVGFELIYACCLIFTWKWWQRNQKSNKQFKN